MKIRKSHKIAAAVFLLFQIFVQVGVWLSGWQFERGEVAVGIYVCSFMFGAILANGVWACVDD